MRIIGGLARGTKLYTLDGTQTRPTLDRVKEPLFNILNFKLQEAIVLDLFAGSGALGLESLSRGARKTFFCEHNRDASKIIKRNIEKTHFEEKTTLIENDYKKALVDISNSKIKFDVIFLDPPYKADLVKDSLNRIINLNLLNKDAVIVIETDNPEDIKEEIDDIDIDIYDERKYGRVSLIFLKLVQKG